MGVAFVTGASRGIGKAIALALAAAGHDVALSARTVAPGEEREHSSTLRRSDTTPLPGSLEETASLAAAEGVRALIVQADLLDIESLTAAVDRTTAELGPIDILVNNGRYIGPGHMDLIVDTPLDLVRTQIEANVIAPIHLIKLVLPSMIERATGSIVNITSGAGYQDPPGPVGAGGWGLGYGVTKGGFHRIAGIVALEYPNVHAWNVQPGFVATERMAQDMAAFGFDSAAGAPPAVIGAVVRWLVEHPDELANGSNIEAQDFCAERDLMPGWAGPSEVR